jgi:hypothetical protein
VPLPYSKEHPHELYNCLETLFLGQAHFYWLGDISHLDAKLKKKIITYSATYTGPHRFGFFITTDQVINTSESVQNVKLDAPITSTSISLLTSFFNYPTLSSEFSEIITQNSKHLSLEHVCMLLEYQSVISKKLIPFFKPWVSRIIVSDKNAFALSQYFFEKNQRKFWQEWQSLKENFEHEFWIYLWSDLLWQATLFIEEAHKNGPEAARKHVKRLPFSFMQKDWRQYKIKELAQTHDFLYTIDYNNKNGGSTDVGLELLYNKFFLNHFA